MAEAGGQEGAVLRGVCGGCQPDSWSSRHSSASCSPACLPASLARSLARLLAAQQRERERKSPSRHGPPAAALGGSRGMTTVHMVINSSC